MHLENRDPSPVSVRILSSYTANGNDTAAGVALEGPVVAVDTQVNGSATKDLSIPAPPVVPASLGGRLATYVIVSEWNGGDELETDECMVFLPEPGATSQILAGVSVLLVMVRRRGVTTHCRMEVES